MTENEEFEFRHRLEQEQGAQKPPEGAVARVQRQLAGGVDAGASLVSGALATPVAGLAGISQGIANMVVPGQISAADRVAQVQNALTHQPADATSQDVAGKVAYPLEKVAEAGDYFGKKAAGTVTALGGSPEAAASTGALANTSTQVLPQLLGKAAQPYAQRAALLARTKADVEAKLAAPRDAAIKAARDAGYVLPPAEANPNLLNRILEGFSGQAKVQQLASAKNQPVTNAIVRKGLGIAPDAPITIDTLEAVRKQAGAAYEKVRNLGEVATDAQYSKALDKIVEKYEGAAKSFAEETSDVQKAVDSARNTVKAGSFDAGSGVDKIKLERARADKAFRQGDTELGKAHKAIADTIEEQIQRHLDELEMNHGIPPAAVAEMRQARQLIAKSYDVQKALKGNDVDARVLAAQLRKGKPMTGGLRDAAQFADRFPGAAQTGGKNAYTPISYFDGLYGGGAVAGALMHSPHMGAAAAAGVAATAVRPGIRAGILSKPYQAGMTQPSHGPGFRTLGELVDSDPALMATYGLQGEGDFRRLKEAP
jgi:hypothetical protein